MLEGYVLPRVRSVRLSRRVVLIPVRELEDFTFDADLAEIERQLDEEDASLVVTPAMIERFWTHVEKGEACWAWTLSLREGYGRFVVAPGVIVQAHRFAYELANGPIPDGHEVHHRTPPCTTRACVNPAHLEAMEKAEHRRLHRSLD